MRAEISLMRFIYPESKCSSSHIVKERLHSWPSGSALAESLTLHSVCFYLAVTCDKILAICSSAINWRGAQTRARRGRCF